MNLPCGQLLNMVKDAHIILKCSHCQAEFDLMRVIYSCRELCSLCEVSLSLQPILNVIS